MPGAGEHRERSVRAGGVFCSIPGTGRAGDGDGGEPEAWTSSAGQNNFQTSVFGFEPCPGRVYYTAGSGFQGLIENSLKVLPLRSQGPGVPKSFWFTANFRNGSIPARTGVVIPQKYFDLTPLRQLPRLMIPEGTPAI